MFYKLCSFLFFIPSSFVRRYNIKKQKLKSKKMLTENRLSLIFYFSEDRVVHQSPFVGCRIE